MSRKGGKRTSEMVARLVELGVPELVDLGIPEPQARQAMREIAHSLTHHYGGQFMYVPKDQEFALSQRDLAIYAKVTSSNVNEVAAEYGLTARQVYAINRHVHLQRARLNQGSLPGFDDPAG